MSKVNKTILNTTKFIYLYNLLDNGYNIQDINYYLSKIHLEEHDNTKFINIDKKSLTLKILILIDLSNSTIDILHEHYNDMSDLITSYNELLYKINLTPTNKNRLDSLIREIFNSSYRNQLIYEFINKFKPISIMKLFRKINILPLNITIDEIKQACSVLLYNNEIKLTSNGFTVSQNKIIEYLNKNHHILNSISMEEINIMMNKKIKNLSKNEKKFIADLYDMLPKSKKSKKLEIILSKYDVDECLGSIIFDDMITYRFIKLYLINNSIIPHNTGIQYILENYNSNESNKILSKYGYIQINGKYIKKNKSSLLDYYLDNLSNMRILRGVNGDFKDFLENLGLNYDEINDESNVWETLNCKNQVVNINNNYLLYVKEEFFDEEFLSLIKKELNNLEGAISLNYIYNKNKELFKNNDIRNATELINILVNLFRNEFGTKFYFNEQESFIESTEISFYDFATSIISEVRNMDINEYYHKVRNKTGLNNDQIQLLSKSVIEDYLQDDNKLTTTSKLSILERNKGIIHKAFGSYFIEQKIFHTNLKKNSIRNINPQQLNNSDLAKIGLSRYKNMFYENNYETFDSAFINWLEFSSNVIDESMIEKKIPKSSMHFDKFLYGLYLVEFKEFNYYNITNLMNRNQLLKFRNQVVDRLENGTIFSMKSLKQLNWFNELIKEYNEIISLDDFEEGLIENSIRQSPKITSVKGKGTAMKKGGELKKEEIIYEEIKENNKIYIADLEMQLKKKYNIINIETSIRRKLIDYYNIYIDSQEIFYSNKNLYNKDVEDFLKNENK